MSYRLRIVTSSTESVYYEVVDYISDYFFQYYGKPINFISLSISSFVTSINSTITIVLNTITN
jgi:hypothetical protein